ncbi:MAG: hypothetical protein JWN14_5045 [Chthonomonadales bacterium]|nr:hypothetical protein [Chthonomonadales bacterium]
MLSQKADMTLVILSYSLLSNLLKSPTILYRSSAFFRLRLPRNDNNFEPFGKIGVRNVFPFDC